MTLNRVFLMSIEKPNETARKYSRKLFQTWKLAGKKTETFNIILQYRIGWREGRADKRDRGNPFWMSEKLIKKLAFQKNITNKQFNTSQRYIRLGPVLASFCSVLEIITGDCFTLMIIRYIPSCKSMFDEYPSTSFFLNGACHIKKQTKKKSCFFLHYDHSDLWYSMLLLLITIPY